MYFKYVHIFECGLYVHIIMYMHTFCCLTTGWFLTFDSLQVAELEAKAKDHAKLSAARGDAEDVHVKLASLEKEIEEVKESLGQSQSAYEAAAKELQIVSEVTSPPSPSPYHG